MASYTKATNFTAKDGLPTGNAGKIVKGAEIDTELTAVSNAIASKADINSPTFTGTPAAPTATAGTNTTQVATTAFVIAERTNTATLTNKTLTSPTINTPTISTPAITGGTITGITDLAVADGGTGVSTIAANAVILGNGTSAIQTVAPSTAGNILTSNGTTWTSAALVLYPLTSGTAVASTSGTSIDFTSIPSWVKRITVMFSGVSTSGSSNYLIQAGSTTFQTTGYSSRALRDGSSAATATAGFLLTAAIGTGSLNGGLVTLTNISGNLWVFTSILADATSGNNSYAGGYMTSALSGTLDRVRITTVNGTDTFDAGSINILYE